MPMLENHVNFRAPPSSPVSSARNSCVTDDDRVFTDSIEHSRRVPDLILSDKIFPKQQITKKPSKIDFQLLSCVESESVSLLLDSISSTGCFQLVNYGIPVEFLKLALSASAGIFGISPEKKVGLKRSPENPYGFEEVHSEEESELSEEFVWCRDENLKFNLEGIWPVGHSDFSTKLETLLSEMDKVAEKILQIISDNSGKESTYMMQGQEDNGSFCHIYKHRQNITSNQWLNSFKYDVIRMLIRGIDHSHAISFHISNGASDFHVYSKKGWLSFSPHKHALVVTVGDQILALSDGDRQYKHVIGRPMFKGEMDCISMAIFCSLPIIRPSSVPNKQKTISLAQQALLALLLTLVYHFLLFVYYKF